MLNMLIVALCAAFDQVLALIATVSYSECTCTFGTEWGCFSSFTAIVANNDAALNCLYNGRFGNKTTIKFRVIISEECESQQAIMRSL